jgi:hypothetical protein
MLRSGARATRLEARRGAGASFETAAYGDLLRMT